MTTRLPDHLSYPPRAMRAERAAAYLKRQMRGRRVEYSVNETRKQGYNRTETGPEQLSATLGQVFEMYRVG